MSCWLRGNHKPVVSLAMRHRLQWMLVYSSTVTQGLSKRYKHPVIPPTLFTEYSQLYLVNGNRSENANTHTHTHTHTHTQQCDIRPTQHHFFLLNGNVMLINSTFCGFAVFDLSPLKL